MGRSARHALARTGAAPARYVPESEPRRLSAVESTAEAVRMVERLQRLFQNTLRMSAEARGEKHGARPVDWFGALVGRG